MAGNSYEPAEGFAVPVVRSDIIETDALVQQIQILARTQCTLEEAAGYLGLIPDEFKQFLVANRRSFIAWHSGPAAGRAVLKMQQFKSAQLGSDRMQVWLGKNVLGQSENPTVPADKPPERRNDDWDNLSTWRMPRLG